MTTVAAFVDDGKVFMAADSCATVYDRHIRGVKKIRRYETVSGEQFLIGYAGITAIADCAESSLQIVVSTHSSDMIMLNKFAFGIAKIISGVAIDCNITENGRLDATCLLAYRGNVWTISHMGAIHHENGIAAIGSGEAYAIGAMYALHSRSAPGPFVASEAVGIAIHNDIYSGGDVNIETLGRVA